MFESLLSELKPFYEVAVLSHIRPDADCIGAQSGVCSLLEAHNIKYTAFNEDPVPSNLLWMKHAKKIQLLEPGSLQGFEAVIFVDGNQTHRFTRKGDMVYEGSPFMSLIIDHHPNPDTNFDIVCSDPTASSTCELIFRWFEQVVKEGRKTTVLTCSSILHLAKIFMYFFSLRIWSRCIHSK